MAISRGFADSHAAEIDVLRDYVIWLQSKDRLAPSTLFTYRVWGSTRAGDRMIETEADTFETESRQTIRSLVEVVLGVRSSRLYVLDREYLNLGAEIWEADPERSDQMEVPIERVVARATPRVLDEAAVYFEEIRQSLRNIKLDIEKCMVQRDLFQSDAFWRQFILTTIRSRQTEQRLWDLKETLTVWHTKARDERRKSKVGFAEKLACFANTSGGVLVVGVTDRREVVGIGGDGRTIEQRLRVVAQSDHLEYPRLDDVVQFHQVLVPDEAGTERTCLAIVVADACEPVGVHDGEGHYSYPVRRETGLERVSRDKLLLSKQHQKNDNYDFVSDLEQFIRDT